MLEDGLFVIVLTTRRNLSGKYSIRRDREFK